MKKLIICACLAVCCITFTYGQSKKSAQLQLPNTLNQYGIAPLFLGGLFREGLPVSEIKKLGSFGIAAPSLVDGELIACNGTIYQTKSNGETRPAPDTLKVPFGMFCFFKADTAFQIDNEVSQLETEKMIGNYLKNRNGIYAVRITGTFARISTRAFHKVDKEPFPPVADIQAAQQLFSYNSIEGTIFGYRMPLQMGGISGTGYHFHFLSANTMQGGHVLTYSPESVKIEIALIRKFFLQIPDDPAFRSYQTTTIQKQ